MLQDVQLVVDELFKRLVPEELWALAEPLRPELTLARKAAAPRWERIGCHRVIASEQRRRVGGLHCGAIGFTTPCQWGGNMVIRRAVAAVVLMLVGLAAGWRRRHRHSRFPHLISSHPMTRRGSGEQCRAVHWSGGLFEHDVCLVAPVESFISGDRCGADDVLDHDQRSFGIFRQSCGYSGGLPAAFECGDPARGELQSSQPV